MKEFIFNEEYFIEKYMCDKTSRIGEKLEAIGNIIGIDEETVKKKRSSVKHFFNRTDYDLIIKKEPMLLLDTQKLIYKFFERANLDMGVNQKYVAFIMLSSYDCRKTRNKWISIDELGEIYSFKRKKVVEILEKSNIIIDNKGNKENMFLKNKNGLYVINISAFIKYSNIWMSRDKYIPFYNVK